MEKKFRSFIPLPQCNNIMKKIFIFKFFITALLFSLYNNSYSQVLTPGDNISLVIQDQATIAINASPISLNLTVLMAGEAINPASNSTLYVKISSLVPTGKTRKITARVASGSVPPGTKLTLLPSSCTTANSAGLKGNAISTPIILSSVDQNLITGIGSCYTGTGSTDGYNMQFNWSLINASSYGLIVPSSYNVTISFTITAAE